MKKMAKTYISFIFYVYFPVAFVLLGRQFFNYKYTSSNLQDVIWLNVICDVTFFIVLTILNFDIFKKKVVFEGNTKKEKIKNFAIRVLIVTAIFYGVKIGAAIITSLLLTLFGLSDTAVNQQLIEEMFKSAPVLSILTGVICAPVVEELLFRGTVRRIIKDKRVFVIVSGLLFGLVHVLRYDLPLFGVLVLGCLIDSIITSQIDKKKKIGLSLLASVVMLVVLGLSLHMLSGDLIKLLTTIKLSEVINSITYITMGIFLAIIYVKYDNIYLNILCHLINNALAFILLFT
nr:CPBP family intramembrane metalloprotease [Bacilli bacterium]